MNILPCCTVLDALCFLICIAYNTVLNNFHLKITNDQWLIVLTKLFLSHLLSNILRKCRKMRLMSLLQIFTNYDKISADLVCWDVCHVNRFGYLTCLHRIELLAKIVDLLIRVCLCQIQSYRITQFITTSNIQWEIIG